MLVSRLHPPATVLPGVLSYNEPIFGSIEVALSCERIECSPEGIAICLRSNWRSIDPGASEVDKRERAMQFMQHNTWDVDGAEEPPSPRESPGKLTGEASSDGHMLHALGVLDVASEGIALLHGSGTANIHGDSYQNHVIWVQPVLESGVLSIGLRWDDFSVEGGLSLSWSELARQSRLSRSVWA